MKTFHLISLGCPKNLVDSEVVYGLLEKHGWRGVDRPEIADVLLVNTCGFIRPAVEESIEEILALSRYKEEDSRKRLVVVGCLVQRYRDSLAAELPEVDLFVGSEGIARIPDLLTGLDSGGLQPLVEIPERFLMDAALPRRLSTPSFRAWLKITEGCDNRCSYCMIPSIRGPLRSRSLEDVIAEATALEKSGVREVSLVAQDLTAYGRDRQEQGRLVALLERLLEATGIEWIRLLYLYPSGITPELLELMAVQPRLVPYLDIPLQHISDAVLRRMNRHYTRSDVAILLERIRRVLPEAALRTTFLLGFPGERESDVDELVDFLAVSRFHHVGVFAYANEEGSPAEHLGGQVAEQVKTARVERVLAVQSEISAGIQQGYVGRVEPVLIEGVSKETDLLLEGRTRFQAPDIDGCVLINEGDTSPGEIVEVEITEAHVYDLVGRIVAQSERSSREKR